MELLNRYLQAVKFWLPSAQQDDIAAELREDICSEIDEREKELGRKLNDNEVEALLKQRGRPLLVAEQYLPQRSLIGPVLFPAYWFVLRLVWLCYLVPWVGVWVALVLFSPPYRAQHLGPAIVEDLLSLAVAAVMCATVVTIIFAILESVKDKTWLTDDWSPRKLPPVRDAQRISRTNSAFELVFGIVLGLWWLKILWTLRVIDTDTFRLSLSPAWHSFFWALLPIWLVNTALSAANFWRPYRTRTRRAVKAAANFATAAVLAMILKIQPALIVGPQSAGPAKAVDVAWNLGLAISFAIVVVIALAIGCVELWRIYSETRKRARLQHRLA